MAELLCRIVSFGFVSYSPHTDQWTRYERLAPQNAVDPLPVFASTEDAEERM